MKKFIQQASRQSGMIRLTVICTLLIAFTLIGFSIGYQKFSTTAHALPVSKNTLATHDCGCHAEKDMATAHGFTGFQTPPASRYTKEQISHFMDVLLLPAGDTLNLRVSTTDFIFVPTKNDPYKTDDLYQPNGEWSAKYGKITSDGIYTAPRYIPARGLDTIEYRFPKSPELAGIRINILIKPNASIPGSESTPYTQGAIKLDADGMPEGILWQPALKPGTAPPVSLAELKFQPISLVRPGQTLPERVQTTATTNAASRSRDGLQEIVLPAANLNTGYTTKALYVVQNPQAAPLEQAKELPIFAGSADQNPDPVAGEEKTKCEGTGYVYDPVIQTGTERKLQEPAPVDNGKFTIDVDAQTGAAKLIPAITLKVGGEVDIIAYNYTYTNTGIQQRYKCVNGKRVIDKLLTCSQTNIGIRTLPSWYGVVVDKLPANGDFDPSMWTSWVCHE